MRKHLRLTIAGLVVLVGVGLVSLSRGDDYSVDVVVPSATNLVPGSPVTINGFSAGKVKKLQAKDGKAVITVSLKKDFAPLHDGTTAKISWKALLGERILELAPGDKKNAALASGAMIKGIEDRVEIDQVLAALDVPTRAHLNSLVSRLDGTLDGSQDDLNNTLKTAGPAVQALGQVLSAVGNDGPAIHDLVTRLTDMTTVFAKRQAQVSDTIGGFSTTVNVIAGQREALQKGLKELPPTLTAANKTLKIVPSTVDVTVPLLNDLKPAVGRLPAVSKQLSPVLTDMRPVVATLKPTLAALEPLLNVTPSLLDSAHQTLPGVTKAVTSLEPAVEFLRPYMPELAGWLSNWGSAAGNYDSNGHYLRAFIQQGGSSFTNNPGIVPPGIKKNPERVPGENEHQPWTDANGSEMR